MLSRFVFSEFEFGSSGQVNRNGIVYVLVSDAFVHLCSY
jgi:hypothetical protein